jgi:guanine deaminase
VTLDPPPLPLTQLDLPGRTAAELYGA